MEIYSFEFNLYKSERKTLCLCFSSRLHCLDPSDIRHQDARMIVVVLAGPYRAYPLHFVGRRDSTPRRQKRGSTVNYASESRDYAAWRTDLRNHLGDLPHM